MLRFPRRIPEVFQVLVLTILLPIVPNAAFASAADSERWFNNLPKEEQVLLQMNLTLLGRYTSLVDGEFGPGTYRAITEFQKERGLVPSGVLTRAQLEAMTADATEIFAAMGMETVEDQRARISLFVPRSLLRDVSETRRGNAYATQDGGIVLETIRKPVDEESFAELFATLSTDTAHRRITYTSFTTDRFVVSGMADGELFYLMFHDAGDASVGFSLSWPRAQNELGVMLAMFTASLARPLSENTGEERQPGSSTSSGSGFFFAAQGMILTNQHVVEGCTVIEVTGFGRATVLKSDSGTDLAVLQLRAPKPHKWARVRLDPPRLGEPVILLGYPLADILNSSLNVGTGIVSAEKAVGSHPEWFTTDAGIQPGNSGGPILDEAGNVVGVAVAKADDRALLASAGTTASNIGFAINNLKVLEFIEIFRHDPPARSGTRRSVQEVAEDGRDFTVQVMCES